MKLFNFNCDEKLIKEVDNFIEPSNKYKDRTQFIILAIEEKLKNEAR